MVRRRWRRRSRRLDPGSACIHVRLADGVTHANLGHHVPRTPGERDEGSWVSWDWDGTALTVRNDHFAADPTFCAASGDPIAISPSIERLLSLGTPTELDLLGRGRPVR